MQRTAMISERPLSKPCIKLNGWTILAAIVLVLSIVYLTRMELIVAGIFVAMLMALAYRIHACQPYHRAEDRYFYKVADGGSCRQHALQHVNDRNLADTEKTIVQDGGSFER